MTYFVVKLDDRKFALTEMPDGLVIKQDRTRKSLESLAYGLSMGCGFNGYTPAFFSNRKYIQFREKVPTIEDFNKRNIIRKDVCQDD